MTPAICNIDLSTFQKDSELTNCFVNPPNLFGKHQAQSSFLHNSRDLSMVTQGTPKMFSHRSNCAHCHTGQISIAGTELLAGLQAGYIYSTQRVNMATSGRDSVPVALLP